MSTNNGTDEPRPNAADQAADAAMNALRQVWWAGLGLVAVAGEEANRLAKTLVEKGREVEPGVFERSRKAADEMSHAASDVGSKIKDFACRVGREAEGAAQSAQSALDDRVKASLDRMGFPTRDELRDLAAKLDALAAKLDNLARRSAG